MTNTEFGSSVQVSDSLVKLVSVSADIPLRDPTHSQFWASSHVTGFVKIRNQAPHTGFGPTSTRISRPKQGALASTLIGENPASQISFYLRYHDLLQSS